MTGRPAVFLDRDGVLNDVRMEDGVAKPPIDLDDLVVGSGVVDGVRRLREAGYLLVCVTNQPDIAAGTVTRDLVDRLNGELVSSLSLDAVYVCPHRTADGCECRKPRAGMLLAAARDLGIDLADSWLVGDRWVDVAAGLAAGVEPILLETPYSWNESSSGRPASSLRRVASVPDFGSAVDRILASRT